MLDIYVSKWKIVLVMIIGLLLLGGISYFFINYFFGVSVDVAELNYKVDFVEGEHLTECSVLNLTNTTYYLDSDVVSKGSCFVVEADNVVLNCLGHKIDDIHRSNNSVGILSEKDFTTVKNCIVNGFDIGLHFKSNKGGEILDSLFEWNREGIYLWISNENIIKNNFINNNKDFGIHLRLADGNNIEGNYLKGDGYGIYLSSSNENNIILNEGYENNWYGVYLFKSLDNFLSRNKFCSNAHTDIRVDKGEILNGESNSCGSVSHFNDIDVVGCSSIC